jgi:cytochrome c oxidase cbb3-type subunit 2
MIRATKIAAKRAKGQVPASPGRAAPPEGGAQVIEHWHRTGEGLPALFTVLTAGAVIVASLFEILPTFLIGDNVPRIASVKPYTPLELHGRDIYIAEGCVNCHSQMVRPFLDETVRYGMNGKPAEYSRPGEFIYDHPFQWGSKRTGPDLARVGGRYGDEWHRIHLTNPRDVVPESNMPAYPWLAKSPADASHIVRKFEVLHMLGVPYTPQDIKGAKAELEGKTELDAVIAYLQVLGTSVKAAR